MLLQEISKKRFDPALPAGEAGLLTRRQRPRCRRGGFDPRPVLRAPIQIVGRGEDRLDGIRIEEVVEFASMHRVQWSQSLSLPGRCSSNI